jgi:DNA-directed RNA polymerase specialized sigma subunit
MKVMEDDGMGTDWGSREENEKKKAYLLSYRKYRKMADRLTDQLEEVRLGKMFPSASQSDMPGAHNTKDLSDYMERCEELETRIIKARMAAVERFEEVRGQIELLEDEDEKMLLTLRYLTGLKWDGVMKRVGVEWTQVHRIHDRALRHFEIKEHPERDG